MEAMDADMAVGDVAVRHKATEDAVVPDMVTEVAEDMADTATEDKHPEVAL